MLRGTAVDEESGGYVDVSDRVSVFEAISSVGITHSAIFSPCYPSLCHLLNHRVILRYLVRATFPISLL